MTAQEEALQFRWIDWNRQTKMSRKKPAKPYLEMTTEELHKATEEFDKEFVADRAQPLSPQMRRRWERAKAKSPRFKRRHPPSASTSPV